MDRLADVFVCSGVMLFFLGAVALAYLGTAVMGGPLLPATAIFSIVLIGTGSFFKIKKRKG